MGVADRCLMTWEPRKSRWRKMFKGKVFTVSCEALGTPDNKADSYQAANEWWRKKQAELDGQPRPHQAVLDELDRRLECAVNHGHDRTAEDVRQKRGIVQSIPQEAGEETAWTIATHSSEADDLIDLARHHGIIVPPNLDPTVKDFLFGQTRVWEGRFQGSEPTGYIPEDKTIGGQIVSWLANQETKVHAGQLSPGQHNNVRLCLQNFRDFLGSSTPVDRLDEMKIGAYYVKLIGEIAVRRKDSARQAGMSRDYAAKHFAIAKKFVRHLWSMGLIDLPKNIDSKEFNFKKAPRIIPTMSRDEVRTLVERATGQLQLHLLLMINCGMTQSDIADLKDGEVDWEDGRVVRKRSKTDEHEDVPVVNYKLWPETFRLLKQFRSGQETVLLTRNGTVWAWESIVDGKYVSNDSIATVYNNLKAKLKKSDKTYVPKPLKLLRKTSATIIESHEQYGRYVPHFLGHSPRTIKDRHYAAPSVELFDKVIGWLGAQYGFDVN